MRRFFETWPASTISLMAKTNFYMWCLTKEYISFRWNPKDLMAAWFEDVEGFFSVLGESGAVICGPSVSNFFNRSTPYTVALDICIDRDSLRLIVQFLTAERYNYPGDSRFTSTFSPTVAFRVYTFLFHKFPTNTTVAIHVVHGDPVGFLLFCGTSAYIPNNRRFRKLTVYIANAMNFISSERAISIFPRTTFLCKNYVRCSQDHFLTNGEDYIWPVVRNTEDFTLLRDEDTGYREIGAARQAGDALCWILPTIGSDEIHARTSSKSPWYKFLTRHLQNSPDEKTRPIRHYLSAC